MAKIRPGVGWSEARGSVAGATYCRSSSGLTLRARSLGPGRTTIRATNYANRIAARAAAWRGLTQAQRDQWDTAAATNGVPGYRSGLSGFQLYVAVTGALREAGLSAVTVPPLGARPAAITFADPVQSGQTSIFTLNQSHGNPGTGGIVLRVSQPLPPQLARSRNPSLHYLAYIASTPYTAGANWATAWWSGTMAQFSGYQLIWQARLLLLNGARGPVIERRVILA